MTAIGRNAFIECSSLTDVYCYATKVPTTGSNVFSSVPTSSATLHVPAASLEAYKTTAPWSEFGNIVALTDEETDGISNLSPALSQGEGEQVVYDLSGRRISKMQKGINIIHQSDGSVRKVLIK